MSDFDLLKKVRKAIDQLGEAPYDDKKTEESARKGTLRAIAIYNELKEKKKNNENENGSR